MARLRAHTIVVCQVRLYSSVNWLTRPVEQHRLIITVAVYVYSAGVQSAVLSCFSHFLKAFQSTPQPPAVVLMVSHMDALFKDETIRIKTDRYADRPATRPSKPIRIVRPPWT